MTGASTTNHRLETAAMIEINSILLPTDFSEPSLEATRYAVEFARRFGATLHLLNVIEDPVVYLPMFESYPLPSREDFEQYAQTRLENWISDEEVADLELVFAWRHGAPVLRIIEYAGGESVDLIVVGTHGHGMAAHLLLGSVAEKVIRKAPCPVLAIRPGEHGFVHPAT